MRHNLDHPGARPGLFRWAVLAVVLFVGAGLVRMAGQPVDAAPINNPVIATVKVSEVINGLEELKDREAELRLFIDEQKAGIQKIGDELQELVDELNILPDGAAQKREKLQKAMRLRLNLEVEDEISTQLIDQRRGEVYAQIFKKINESAKLLAQRNGYHLILTDDSDTEVRPDTERNVRAGILTRRVLYSDPSMDITDELILSMNNAWKAGG